MGDPARSRTRGRRSLHGRHAGDRARLDRGLPRSLRCRRTTAASRRAGRACNGSLRYLWRRLRAVQSARPRARATSRTTTISTSGSTRCSSTPTGNTAAPISSIPSSRSTTRSSPRSATSRPSCCASRDARVLDIGSGWGGLGLYLAEMCGARVTGVTLSDEQLALSRERADEKGLADRVAFRLQDYRDIAERFDRIVSVGMFEHVGVGHYDAFFRKCAELLADDGVMLLHSIGRSEGPGITNPWIAQVHFPRRLHPGPLRGAAGGRARRIAGHRHRDPAAALRRDAEALARALPRASRRPANGSTTRASCACGNSISRRPR